MIEILGIAVFFLLALYWIVIAGARTNTVKQSATALVIYSSLNFGLFAIFGLVADEATHYWFGLNLANTLASEPNGGSSGFPPGKESYVWLLALLVIVFGPSPLPALALSVLFMVTLPAILVSTGRNLGLLNSGALTGWLAVLSPPLLIWGHGLNREPLVFFLLGSLLLSFSRLARGKWVSGALGVAVVALSLSSTRSSLLAVVAAGACAFIVVRFLDVRQQTIQLNPGLSGRSRFAFLVATPLLFVPIVWLFLQVLDSSTWRNFGAGIPELSGSEQATAVVGASWENNTTIDAFLYNALRALFGPLPWEVTNSSLLFFAIEGLGYLVIVAAIVLGVFANHRVRRVGLALFVTVSPLVVAAALLMANYGLNSRIRAHVFVLLIILVEPTVEKFVHRMRKVYSVAAVEEPADLAAGQRMRGRKIRKGTIPG